MLSTKTFGIINSHKIIAMFPKSIVKFLITLTPSIFIIPNLVITSTYYIVKQCLIIILTYSYNFHLILSIKIEIEVVILQSL